MINYFVLFAEFFSAYKLEKKNARGGRGGECRRVHWKVQVLFAVNMDLIQLF